MRKKLKRTIKILFLVIFCYADRGSAQTTIAAGFDHCLAICSDSTVVGWRYNFNGQLGNGNSTNTLVPVHANSLSGAIAIAGGGNHSLAAKGDGTLWAWGDNGWGQLGDPTIIYESHIPIQVNSLTGIIAVAAGGGHSLALKNDGTVWAFGHNYLGQLGNGTLIDTNLPVQVNLLSDIIAIAAGQEHSLALKSDGTVWAWGNNEYGQLGNGTNTHSNIPVQVTGLFGVTAISSGGYAHSFALKSDSTVWAWGDNEYGQHGNGTFNNSNVPVPVSSLTSVIKIAGGGVHALAIKSDSTVWAWGSPGANGTTSTSSIPLQVNPLSGIASIAAGGQNSLALKNNGTLWVWGDNQTFVFGVGYVGYYGSIPIQLEDVCSNVISVNDNATFINSGFTIFPNPATTQLTISGYTPAYLKLSNTLGQTVAEASNTNNLLLGSLPQGLYVLQVFDAKGSLVKVEKVVKE